MPIIHVFFPSKYRCRAKMKQVQGTLFPFQIRPLKISKFKINFSKVYSLNWLNVILEMEYGGSETLSVMKYKKISLIQSVRVVEVV